MADTFKKVVVESPTTFPSSAEDAWKDVRVEREHQPEKVKSNLTYRNMERQVAEYDRNLISIGETKSALEAEMVKVKAIAEA